MGGKLINDSQGRASKEERGHDCYISPPVAVQALMAHEALPEVVWEPACGDGTGMVLPIRETGRTVYATDIVDRGCPDSSISDFLDPGLLMKGFLPHFGAIITNPPYDDVDAFIEKSLSLAPDVYMLLRLTYLGGVDGKVRNSGQRTRLLEKSGLRRILVFRERLPALHREGWEGNKVPNPVTYAWFCWRRGFRGKRATDRISCREIGPPLPPPTPKLPKGYCSKTKEFAF